MGQRVSRVLLKIFPTELDHYYFTLESVNWGRGLWGGGESGPRIVLLYCTWVVSAQIFVLGSLMSG